MTNERGFTLVMRGLDPRIHLAIRRDVAIAASIAIRAVRRRSRGTAY
jgi:hypothetical protein